LSQIDLPDAQKNRQVFYKPGETTAAEVNSLIDRHVCYTKYRRGFDRKRAVGQILRGVLDSNKSTFMYFYVMDCYDGVVSVVGAGPKFSGTPYADLSEYNCDDDVKPKYEVEYTTRRGSYFTDTQQVEALPKVGETIESSVFGRALVTQLDTSPGLRPFTTFVIVTIVKPD